MEILICKNQTERPHFCKILLKKRKRKWHKCERKERPSMQTIGSIQAKWINMRACTLNWIYRNAICKWKNDSHHPPLCVALAVYKSMEMVCMLSAFIVYLNKGWFYRFIDTYRNISDFITYSRRNFHRCRLQCPFLLHDFPVRCRRMLFKWKITQSMFVISG